MAARERVVFLVRCALVAATIASLWGFHATYLDRAAAEPGVPQSSFARGVMLRQNPEGAERVDVVVERFLHARAVGDARTACQQLSPSQRRVTAWFVSARPAPLSEAGCERHILDESNSSWTTDPRLLRALERGFFVEIDGQVANARPFETEGWRLELIERDGRFWIEPEASERDQWVTEDCSEGGWHGPGQCECIYEQARAISLRRRGPARDGVTLDDSTVSRASRSCA